MTGQGGAIADMESLLRVENDPRLAEMRCPGTDMLLWPMVRTPFLRLILSDLLYDTPIPTALQRGSRKDQVTGMARAGLHNLTAGRRLRAPILIRASAMGGDLHEGRRFNRLGDHFADRAPARSALLEDLGGGLMPENRHSDRVVYHDPILVRATLEARRGARRHEAAARDLVDLVETRARDVLGWTLPAQDRAWYLALVARYIARAPRLLADYTTLLRRLGTRLLIAEEACYGNTMTCLIAAARQLGIVTAEFQHGMVSRGHDAYVLAPVLRDSPAYARMLPDYFLSYGAWWHTQLQVPVTPVAIGNPHGTRMRAAAGGPAANRTGILILGDGIESDSYIRFAGDLARALPDREISLRPHPLERGHFDNHHPSGRIGPVRIDRSPDIYASLVAAHAVVSEMSTGLFEAMGLADRVLMWATPKAGFYLPEHPFETFTDVANLVRTLEAPAAPPGDWTAEDIWAPGWQDNYDSFVQEVIGS